jgi:hypothetical protein
MSRNVLTAAVIAALAVVAGTVSAAAAASPAARPAAATSTTLVFKVVFSPHTIIESNTDNPEAPIALGDENIFHDQLFANGQHAGDSVGSCVAVTAPPATVVGNCTAVFRLPGGDITAQFATGPGPAPKPLAITGGTGIYNSAGGDGTLVEFGNGKGKLTLHVLSLVARSGGT